MKFAIIGLGGRGSTYAHFIKYYGSEIVAVCDPDISKKETAIEYGMPEGGFYTDEDDFFKAGKLADALVIATLDDIHYRQAMKALELGYDILLEKPIAMTLKECEDIRDKAIETGRKVVVCHVLRYSPFYNKMKEILDTGAIGDIVCVEMTENIGYYHYAHSYCRGNWRNTDISTPLILAKNCHDTDMICWLIGHNHEDKNRVIDGINLIWTLNNSASTCCSDARLARIIGTSTQNSFDIVNIDTRERKIRIFRYGAGVNCYGVGGDRFVPDGLDY